MKKSAVAAGDGPLSPPVGDDGGRFRCRLTGATVTGLPRFALVDPASAGAGTVEVVAASDGDVGETSRTGGEVRLELGDPFLFLGAASALPAPLFEERFLRDARETGGVPNLLEVGTDIGSGSRGGDGSSRGTRSSSNRCAATATSLSSSIIELKSEVTLVGWPLLNANGLSGLRGASPVGNGTGFSDAHSIMVDRGSAGVLVGCAAR